MLPSTWKKGTSLRPGPVILRTSAPYSARMRPITGPAMMRQSSRTLMPERMRPSVGLGRGWRGVEDSRLSTVQGGRLMLVLPC